MFRPPKPETIARRAREHRAERQANSASLIKRLAEKASAEGPDSIWTEMLAERLQRGGLTP